MTNLPNEGIIIGIGTGFNIDMNAKTINLYDDLTIPYGTTLKVPSGWTLKCNGNTITGSSEGNVIN